MFFDDSDVSLNFIDLLNSKIIKYPDIYIEIKVGINPFKNPNFKNLNKKIKIIEEKPKTLFICVYHIRLFHTENVFAIGGIDIIKEQLKDNYQQFSLFLYDKKYFIFNKENYNNYERKILNLYDYENNTYNSYNKLVEYINKSKKEIFIDNQYCIHPIINKLLISKKKSSNINIFILTNDIENKNILPSFIISLQYLFNIFYKNNLEKNGIKIIKHNKYTHNKISIFDKKYLLMGSMNLIERSTNSNCDIEMSIFIKNKELCKKLLNYYKNNFNL